MPKIHEMLLNLEGFQCATTVYLNMGYYHIRLIKEAINICTIVLPWVKYKYKHLPMGVYNSPEILQEKTNEMFRGFGFTQAYINDLLIITKGEWSNLLENWN